MQINLTPDFSLVVIFVIFMANYFVVRRFLVRPINEVLTSRETDSRTAEQQYETSLARFNEGTAEIEARLHQARRESVLLREKSRAEAAAHRARAIETIRGKAETVIAESTTQLQADVATAKQQIVAQSEQLARMAAEKIIGRKIA